MSDTVQLERLEIVMEVDTSQVSPGMERMSKQVGGLMERLEQRFGKNMERMRKNLNMDDSTSQTSKQMERVSKNAEKFSGKTSKSMQGITASAEQVSKRMQNMKSSTEQASRKMQSELDDIPAHLERAGDEMSRNEAQIQRMRKEVELLNRTYREQRQISGIGRDGQTQFIDTQASLKTLATLQRKEEQMAKLVNRSDDLGRAYASLEDRMSSLTQAQSVNERYARLQEQVAIGHERATRMMAEANNHQSGSLTRLLPRLNELTSQTERASQSHIKATRTGRGLKGIFDGMRRSVGRLEDAQRNFGSRVMNEFPMINRGAKMMNNQFGQLQKGMGRLLRNVLVFNVLRRGITSMFGALGSALRTNDEFNASLNQIRVNLLTAFYPIWTAILPAINALMSAIARVTGYLASFISLLFGTTFEASRAGAQGLYGAVQDMNDVGGAASGAQEQVEELQRALMGFDEINRIGLDGGNNNAGGGDAPGGIDWGSATDFGVPEWMTRLQDLLRDFFAPIRAAWDNVGYRVMKEWNHMTEQVWRLVRYVARDFLYIWTDGTGQAFMEQIFILLANTLGIIGDIAQAFAYAWDEGGRGKDVIRSLLPTSILELTNAILGSWRDVWRENDRGITIASHILDIITNTGNFAGYMADSIRRGWEEGANGHRIWAGIMDIVIIVLDRVNQLTYATNEWARNLDFSPLLSSIATLLESFQPLMYRMGEGLQWFLENVLMPLAAFTITELVPRFIELLSRVIDVVTESLVALSPLGEWLWGNFLQPLASWTGGAILTILDKLATGFERISDWIRENEELFRVMTVLIGVAFVGAWIKLVGPLNIILGVVGKVVTAFSKLAPVFKVVKAVIAVVKAPIFLLIAAGVLLWQHWDTLSEFAGQAWEKIRDFVGNAISAVASFLTDTDWLELGANLIEGLLQGISNFMSNIGTWIRENIFDPITGWFKNLFGINSPSTVFAEFGRWLIEGLMNGIVALITGPINLITGIWSGIRDGASEWGGRISERVSQTWTNVRENITDRVSQARDNVRDRWDNIQSRTTTAFDNVRDTARNRWTNIRDNVRDRARDTANNVRDRWTDVRSRTTTTFNNVRNNVRDRMNQTRDNVSTRAREVFNNIRDRWRDVNSNTDSTFNNVRSTIGDRFNGVRDTVSSQARGALDATRDRWRDMSQNTTQRMNEIRNQTRDRWNQLRTDVANATQTMRNNTRDRFNQMRDEARDRANRTRELVRNAFNTMRSESITAFNGIRTSLNNVFNQIVNTSRGLGQRMASAIRSGAPAMRAAANDLGRAFGSNVQQSITNASAIQGFSGNVGSEGYGYGSAVGGYAKAFELVDFAKDYLGANDNFSFTIPDVFTAPLIPRSVSSDSNQIRDIEGLKDSLTSAITSAIGVAMQHGDQSDGNINVTVEIDGEVAGRSTVKYINRQTQKMGFNPINM